MVLARNLLNFPEAGWGRIRMNFYVIRHHAFIQVASSFDLRQVELAAALRLDKSVRNFENP